MGELVIGRKGEDHVDSADIASMLRGCYNDIDVVVKLDDDLECTAISANTVEVGAGGCMLQGHFYRVATAEQLTIESGSAGYKRNDLVGVMYTLGEGNIQDGYLTVIKGTATVGDPSDPSYPEGSIDGGSTEVFFPLYRVPLDGVNIGTPVRIMPLYDTLQDQITALGETVYQDSTDVTGTNINYCKLWRFGRIVICSLHTKELNRSTWIELFTIPEGFRPATALSSDLRFSMANLKSTASSGVATISGSDYKFYALHANSDKSELECLVSWFAV